MPQKISKNKQGKISEWAHIIITIIVIVLSIALLQALSHGIFPSLEAKFHFYKGLAIGTITGFFLVVTYICYESIDSTSFFGKVGLTYSFYGAIEWLIKKFSVLLFGKKVDFQSCYKLLDKAIRDKVYSKKNNFTA